MTPEVYKLFHKYCIQECDIPNPTREDVQEVFASAVEHFGSEETAIQLMKVYCRVPLE